MIVHAVRFLLDSEDDVQTVINTVWKQDDVEKSRSTSILSDGIWLNLKFYFLQFISIATTKYLSDENKHL